MAGQGRRRPRASLVSSSLRLGLKSHAADVLRGAETRREAVPKGGDDRRLKMCNIFLMKNSSGKMPMYLTIKGRLYLRKYCEVSKDVLRVCIKK